MLEQSDMAHYLLSLGLVKPRDVVRGGPRRRRRRRAGTACSSPRRATGPAFVVKQAGPRSAAHAGARGRRPPRSGRRRRSWPGRCRPSCTTIRRGRGWSCARPAAARDWSDHHGTGASRASRRASSAAALAALHGFRRTRVERRRPASTGCGGCRSRSHRTSSLLDLSAGGAGPRGARPGEPRPVRPAGASCASDRATRLVHGDLRWDNCLALAAPASRRRTRVLLVDWELAGARRRRRSTSAPCWPSTCVRGSGRSRSSSPADPGRLVDPRGPSARRMRPAVHAFWSAYRRANPQSPALAAGDRAGGGAAAADRGRARAGSRARPRRTS